MGAGQGFERGMQGISNMILPAMQMRMQNQRFDKQMTQRDKQFYDRMVLDQAWRDGMYGGSSMLGGPESVSQSTQPAPQSTPYQVTREPSQAELLKPQFTDPTYTPPQPAQPVNYKAQFSDPNPSPPSAPASPAPVSRATPAPAPGFRGPSPSSTPFSSASSRPFTEQRTFNEPKDTSMVINKMPEVTHQSPQIRRVGPNTALPPASLLRPSMRGMRGY
jgi:hypothetical protein